MSLTALAVIPARYASTRFPGKPLTMIAGRSMVQRVYESTLESGLFARIVVATDDDRIIQAVQSFGGEAFRSRQEHPSGTDRVAEVSQNLTGFDVVANVQGDLPYVPIEALQALLLPFSQDDPPPMSTVACPLSGDDYHHPNSVKVVCDQLGNALYFSRSPIPNGYHDGNIPVYHHLGLYAFRPEFLATYTQLQPTPLEQCERLEQLRVLENGYKIRVGMTSDKLLEVNSPEDVPRVEEMLRKLRSLNPSAAVTLPAESVERRLEISNPQVP